jgi:hypothetical protein
MYAVDTSWYALTTLELCAQPTRCQAVWGDARTRRTPLESSRLRRSLVVAWHTGGGESPRESPMAPPRQRVTILISLPAWHDAPTPLLKRQLGQRARVLGAQMHDQNVERLRRRQLDTHGPAVRAPQNGDIAEFDHLRSRPDVRNGLPSFVLNVRAMATARGMGRIVLVQWRIHVRDPPVSVGTFRLLPS